jgi:sec-independent protein translocase protein TatA
MVGDILQPTHLVFVLLVALLVLGPKKLPEVGRQLGNGLRDFRSAINGETSDLKSALTGEPTAPRPPYEQPASTTVAEHEFAPVSETTTAESHVFAHAEAETPASEHEFAHDADVVETDSEHGAVTAGGHEFAYETADSADKPAEPHA